MRELRLAGALLVSLLLTACPFEEPPVADAGLGPVNSCGRDSYGENTLMTCSNEPSPDFFAGPERWIRSIDTPVIAAPGDEEGQDLIEKEGQMREVAGCGCRRLDGRATGWRHSHHDEGPRTTAGALFRYYDHKLRQFGQTQSCVPGASCADEQIELGFVRTRIDPEIRAWASSFDWGALRSEVGSTCDAPPIFTGRTLSNACSFRIREAGVCHSDCSEDFPRRVMEVAAVLDQALFESNDLASGHWRSKLHFFRSAPLIANETAHVIRHNGEADQLGWRFDLESTLPPGWDMFDRYSDYLPGAGHEAKLICNHIDCWWKDPARPISLERAAFLVACADVSMEDAARNVVDADQDGVCDYWRKPTADAPLAAEPLDNCPAHPNVGQADTDGDAVGDACDNCLNDENPSQEDSFGLANGTPCDLQAGGCVADPTGDACGDVDGDGVVDAQDNCPMVANPASDCDFDLSTPDWQCDFDGDDDGDACDDSDGDGLVDAQDNCRKLSNPAQVDADGDDVGDACEPQFTFISPQDDPTVAAQASAQNEFVFSADNPGVLTVPVQIDLEWDDYDSVIDEIAVQYDAVGDSVCSTSPVTWTPVGATTWRIETELTCTGLPSRYDHFGLKTVSLTLTRRRVDVGRSVDQRFEVFWPFLADSSHLASDANFARNHPAIGPLEVPHPGVRNSAFVLDPTHRFQPISQTEPNWFYYWTQRKIGNMEPYLSRARFAYVPLVYEATLAPVPTNVIVQGLMPLALAVGSQFPGIESNLVYINQGIGQLPKNHLTERAPPPLAPPLANPPNLSRVKSFHVMLYHEYGHVRDINQWSAEGLGPIGQHAWGAPFDITTFWTWYIPGIDNRYRDFDNTNSYSVVDCDLNRVNGIERGGPGNPAPNIPEYSIVQDCGGNRTPGGLDINYDGINDWENSEVDLESFDDDRDVVPDWHDPGGVATFETTANAGALVFSSRDHMPELETLDWSVGGVNYDH